MITDSFQSKAQTRDKNIIYLLKSGLPGLGLVSIKKVSLVLATMCSNTRIEIMIKHSFKSPERNKARGQLDSDEEFQEGCRNNSFYFHQ